jgi:type VI secretion system protein ImpC
MNSPSDEVIATHPLRDGQILVDPNPENPGFYKVTMSIVPHFQVEGLDIQLSLVSKIPSVDKSK